MGECKGMPRYQAYSQDTTQTTIMTRATTTYMTSLGKAMVPLGKSLSRTLIVADLYLELIKACLPLTIPVRST